MSTSKRPNWGIVSTGRIAEDFVYALRRTGATVSAVASRSLASANQFGDKFGIPTRYASYDELAGDADIDIVYIGTPHAFHAANAELFLQHGKSCLVEKPICVNASQLESLMTLAASKNLLLIEGMWTRCFPATQRLRELLESGAIGQVRAVQGTFGFRDNGAARRLTAMDCAGGALLDIGIYLAAMASLAAGGFDTHAPSVTGAQWLKHETGCDAQTFVTFETSNNVQGSLVCSIAAALPNEVLVVGTQGSITVHAPFHTPKRLTVRRNAAEGGVQVEELALEVPPTGDEAWNFGGSAGFVYEVAQVEAAWQQRLTAAPFMPLDESLAIARFFDSVRAKIGLVYDGLE